MRTFAGALLLGAIALLAAGPPAARAAGGPPAALVREWTALNGACRGGSGDDPATQEACTRREEVDRRLAAAGWCYGRPGDLGYQRRWRRCEGAGR